MKTSVLILCTGNSCRSQMAEGFLRSFNPSLRIFSAGTRPAHETHPMALQVMRESGIDISDQHPKNVNQFLDRSFDYVVTVCKAAKESCPVFPGAVNNRLHLGFDDPAAATGSEEERLAVFRRVRDEISTRMRELAEEIRKEE